MNNSLFKDLKHKVFHSGNPSYLYIGISTLVFVVVGLVNVPFFLSGHGGLIYDDFIRNYFGFPAALSAMPTRFYTILTYQFFHGGIFHFLFNMLWLYWMGRIFLDYLNARQFHFVYLSGGFLGALLFALAFNIFPVFRSASGNVLIGSSAAVMAIVIATATLVPNYSIRLLFFGDVKLKYLAAAYIVLDLISTTSMNAGGSFAHIGGAVLGFTYIKMLQNGTDWSNLFKKKPKLRVVRDNGKQSKRTDTARPAVKRQGPMVEQREIDEILDKISKSGYDNLTREEKETLFKASKH